MSSKDEKTDQNDVKKKKKRAMALTIVKQVQLESQSISADLVALHVV